MTDRFKRLSRHQKDWLTHLARNGPDRSRTVTGWFCRRNGLTSFLMEHPEHGLRTHEDAGMAVAASGMTRAEAGWHFHPDSIEAITPKGRKALQARGFHHD